MVGDETALYRVVWSDRVVGPYGAQQTTRALLESDGLRGVTEGYVVLKRGAGLLYALRVDELRTRLSAQPDDRGSEAALGLRDDQSSRTVWADYPRPLEAPALPSLTASRLVSLDRSGRVLAVGEPDLTQPVSTEPELESLVPQATTPGPPEGTSITRYPSIKPDHPAVPNTVLQLTVDLTRTLRDRITQGDPLALQGLPQDWQDLAVHVELVSPSLTFDGDANAGEIHVKRDADSVPLTTQANVSAESANVRSFPVRADFYYAGRWSGSATRDIPTASAPVGPGAPAPAPAPTTPTTPATAPAPAGGVAIDPVAEAPVLSVRISQLNPGSSADLIWTLNIPAQYRVAALPASLSDRINVGANVADFAKQLFQQAAQLVPGQHVAVLQGIGEAIYDRTPECFKQAYWALRSAHGPNFPIQFVSDEPYVPWELMRPVQDETQADVLALAHPVARMLCSYEGYMDQHLPRGTMVTIAPQYGPRRALPEAQAESQALQTKYAAVPVPGTLAGFRTLLDSPSDTPTIAILHFAGHGVFPFDSVTTSSINLEDGDVQPIEVRQSNVVLGQKFRPLVVFNACEAGQGAAVLGTVGGWADAFLNRRFSGFLAPLWTVYDNNAFTVITALLDQVVNQGATVGAALQSVRAAHGAESPTFYSYLYYGDVMARLAAPSP